MTAALLDDPDAIVGASGAGKSWTARHKVEQLLAAGRQTIIFDPTGVWWGLQSDAGGTGPGIDVPVFGGAHANLPIAPNQGEAMAGILLDERVSAVLDLSTFDEQDLRRFALGFLTPLRRRERVNLHLVFDEAEEFAPQTAPDDVGFQLVRQMTWIAKRGRVFGLVPTFITQRPADFAKAVLSQVQTLYFHQLIAPADQAPVRAYLKANADKAILQEVEASLPELARGERWVYSPRRKLLERGVTPAIATFDSMGTPAPGEARREPRMLAELDVERIRAALAGSAEAGSVEQASAAYHTGAAMGELLLARDARIAELEGQLAELEERLRFAVETGRTATDLALSFSRKMLEAAQDAAIQVDAFADNAWRGLIAADRDEASPADLHSSDAVSGEAEGEPAPEPPQARAPRLAPARRRLDPDPATEKAGKALAALARVAPVGLTENQWATQAGYTRSGGTWSKHKAALRAAGLVEHDGRLWRATVAGLAAAGTGEDLPPAAGPDLARWWAERLPATKRMVEALIKRWPHAVNRESLAADLGMSPQGGAFNGYLGQLRANDLVEIEKKRVRLSPALMKAGR